MKGDIAVWMYVLAGLLISIVILSQIEHINAYLNKIKTGDPYPLILLLNESCGKNVSNKLILKGPLNIIINNNTICWEKGCTNISCNYQSTTLKVGRGYNTYNVSIITTEEKQRVELWLTPQT